MIKRVIKKASTFKQRFLSVDPLKTKDVKLEKLGTYHCGWIVPVNLLNEKSICYCVGCGEDISFDLELINMFNCNVFSFDPTPRAIKHIQNLLETVSVRGKMPINNDPMITYDIEQPKLNQYKFFPIGLWSKEEIKRFYAPQNPDYVSHSILNLQKTDTFFDAKCKRLSHIMKELGHTHLDLLKLDIEGAEYEVLKSIIDDKLNIQILLVEFDEGYNKLDNFFAKRIDQSLRKLLNFGYVKLAQDSWNFTLVKKQSLNLRA